MLEKNNNKIKLKEIEHKFLEALNRSEWELTYSNSVQIKIFDFIERLFGLDHLETVVKNSKWAEKRGRQRNHGADILFIKKNNQRISKNLISSGVPMAWKWNNIGVLDR